MADDNLRTIAQQLNGEAETLRTRAAELQGSLDQVHTDLARVEAARAALDGKPAKGKQTTKKAKPGKPAPTREHVSDLVAAVLGNRQPMEEAKLKAAVEKTLAESGRSKMGFALRFKESLASERFVDAPGGYRLAEGDDGKPAPAERATAKV